MVEQEEQGGDGDATATREGLPLWSVTLQLYGLSLTIQQSHEMEGIQLPRDIGLKEIAPVFGGLLACIETELLKLSEV